jgi:tetratricopeptide (TPR) repeat protein
VVRRLSDALVDDGRLVVSQVEAGMPVFDGLAPDPSGSGVYRKNGSEPSGSSVYRKAESDLSGSGMYPTTGGERPHPGLGELLIPVDGVEALPGEHRVGQGQPPSVASVGSFGRHCQTKHLPGSSAQHTTGGAQSHEPGAAGGASIYETALRLWHTDLEEEALRLLEAELRRDPAAAPLHHLQGLILLDVARPEEALTAFRRCTCADPAFVAGHLAQAGLLARAGFAERARIALRTAARLVAGREPDDLVLEWDRLTVADVLDLVATQRRLLVSDARSEVDHA